MAEYTLDDVRERTIKERDSWWNVWFVDPLALRVVRWVANHTGFTPNQLTLMSLLLGLGAAAFFAWGLGPFLILGAILYYLCLLVDGVDGKLARLTDQESLFGSWLDAILDRFRVLICAVALMAGLYLQTGHVVFVWLVAVVVFCDMLRYLNALQVHKMRMEMRSYIAGAIERARATLSMLEPEEETGEQPMSESGEQAVLRHGIAVLTQLLHTQLEKESKYAREESKEQPELRLPRVDLHQAFRSRFPWYQRFWDFLRARRIRTHLVSGIEFQAALFVVAPLLALVSPWAVVGVTVVTAALLLVFELAIVYKLWLSTRDYFRVVDGIEGALTLGAPLAQSEGID